MSILEELDADKPTGGRTCSVCVWLESRSKTERAEWAEAFTKGYSNAAIHRAMKKRDYKFSESVIGKHRRNGHEPV